MPRMVVIADDLTGAADCAAPSAARGFSATILLHSAQNRESATTWPDTDILSIDANTRCLPADDAARITADLLRVCDARLGSEYLLFKKLDSTLRGNVGAELAAVLRARRAQNSKNEKPAILMAPALPSQGRTTVGGRLLVHGVPLEETDIWKTEPRAPQSNISLLLAETCLSCRLIDTTTVRSGLSGFRQAISQSARAADVVVCDAETDDDLRAIAEACAGERILAALAGSAGLASQIPQAMGIATNTGFPEPTFSAGPSLFVVGTAASASQQQARLLEAIPDVITIHATSAALLNTQFTPKIAESLQSGHDVLLMLDEDEHGSAYEAHLLAPALSSLISPCAPLLGGLVATGGETARAILDAFGVRRLRLLGEVETGLPLCVTDGWIRDLPVLTKAGAFGSPQSLICCRDFLGRLERNPARRLPRDRLVD